MSLDRILSQRPDVAWKEVEGSIILMDLGVQKKVHRLNPVGSFIWERINGKNTLDNILKSLCSEFDVDVDVAKKDLIELVDQLLQLGVLDGQ